MKYSEFIKQAYNFDDLRHPDNVTANTVAGGVAGAAIGGGGAYLLAKLLKAKNAWAYGLGGAAAGGAGGAYAGNALTDKWIDLAKIKAAQKKIWADWQEKFFALLDAYGQGNWPKDKKYIDEDDALYENARKKELNMLNANGLDENWNPKPGFRWKK